MMILYSDDHQHKFKFSKKSALADCGVFMTEALKNFMNRFIIQKKFDQKFENFL